MLKHIFTITILLLSTVIIGCSSSSDNKPSSTVIFSLLTDADINPNTDGEPSPIEVDIVYLKEDSKLLSTDYFQLNENGVNTVLGKNYIDHQEFSLIPDQYKTLAAEDIPANTSYIAAIAHYSYADEVRWFELIPVEDKKKNYKILVHIAIDRITMKKEEK